MFNVRMFMKALSFKGKIYFNSLNIFQVGNLSKSYTRSAIYMIIKHALEY